MSNNDDEKRRQYLNNLDAVPLDTLYEFNALSPAPVDTIRKLAQLFETAVGLGLEHSATQHPANQSKVQGGHGTSIYEAARNNKHTKVMTTTIDWYGDGEIVVVKSTYGLDIDFPVLDFRTIEGLYFYIWHACVKDAQDKTFRDRLQRKGYLQSRPYKDSPSKEAFEKLCLHCAKSKQGKGEFCSDPCQRKFWDWCQDQARAGLNSRIKSFQSKLKKIRKEIASI